MRPPILSAERIREVRMIKNVEEFNSELCAKALAPLEILGYREIDVAESSIAEDVAAHRPKRTQRRRNQYRTTRGKAPERGQGIAR